MTTTPQLDTTSDIAECGWRWKEVIQPDGTVTTIQAPLSEEEFLHPQEGYHLPNSTFHDSVAGDAKDMLTRRYLYDPEVGVFRDLVIKWGIPDLGDHCPDTFVAFGIRDKEHNRTEFFVPQEGTCPSLIVEVVSPRYRKTDRETKVKHYAQAGVLEYVILDRRRQRHQTIDEVLGYRLVEGVYLPLTPDEDGLILFETVGLRMGLQEGHLIMVDARTEERLLTSLELEEQANQERERANQERQRAERERQRADQAEQRAAKLAELLRAQGIDPDQM
jgi:hypothetical protein